MIRLIQSLKYQEVTFIRNEVFVGFKPAHLSFLIGIETCPYCGTSLKRASAHQYKYEDWCYSVSICPACKWWRSHDAGNRTMSDQGGAHISMLHRSTKTPSSLDSAINEIIKSRDRLFSMHPSTFEKFVGDLLRSFFDCTVLHVGKSHDNGIDLFLLDSQFGRIPIQVKRRSRPDKTETVAVVREFRGAMVVAGEDEGMIVSTSDHFSRESIDVSKPKPTDLVPQTIHLVDCRRLLDIMGLLVASSSELKSLPYAFFNDPYDKNVYIELNQQIQAILNNS